MSTDEAMLEVPILYNGIGCRSARIATFVMIKDLPVMSDTLWMLFGACRVT
jgi:hypothetical protein